MGGREKVFQGRGGNGAGGGRTSGTQVCQILNEHVAPSLHGYPSFCVISRAAAELSSPIMGLLRDCLTLKVNPLKYNKANGCYLHRAKPKLDMCSIIIMPAIRCIFVYLFI